MQFVLALIFTIFLIFLFNLVNSILWMPYKIQRHFKKQGIRGPGYRPIFGNTRESLRLFAEAVSKPIPFGQSTISRVIPSYNMWSGMYGKTYLYWIGMRPTLAISDPTIIKEVLMNTGGSSPLQKRPSDPLVKQLMGDGLSELQGEKWAIHRRITNLALNMEQVKGWVPTIVDGTMKMLNSWEERRARRKELELDVHKELHNLSAEIISRTIFGSSMEEGKHIFMLQERQTNLAILAQRSFYFPGLRKTCKDTKLGELNIPAGMVLIFPIIAAHLDTEIWGEDAEKFNPMRFSVPQKHLSSFFPWGLGRRICVGQNLAMVEMKIALAMIVRHKDNFRSSQILGPKPKGKNEAKCFRDALNLKGLNFRAGGGASDGRLSNAHNQKYDAKIYEVPTLQSCNRSLRPSDGVSRRRRGRGEIQQKP
ncbi:cytochrome P450 734A1-like protein [Tripterygium wilfordii]|uniref:Cytochrome P450 734A1-like protein n=1 Tax=Tripterygium wilfordii TaxID=458696 RepID=A0A7J7D3V8_TRIWF|nr:cytochrome P450 734A1-like protein [Tripterygium wilfordii]